MLSVVAPHPAPPIVKLTVSPGTTTAGVADTSVRFAVTVTSWLAGALDGLALRVRKVTSVPGPQVTTAELELSDAVPSGADAVIVSTPCLTAT